MNENSIFYPFFLVFEINLFEFSKIQNWGNFIKGFSDLYRVEINAVDIMTNRIDRYNQGKFSQKVFLLYDGIHYDPLFWDMGIPGIPKQTVFQANESVAAASALQAGF